MKKYCIYTRVSTEEQGRSGLGLEAQLDQCREYIARTHGQNIGEFRDIRSGKDRNRPGLRRAMELAAREGATLIVAKLDRLSRDAEYALYLRNTGVDLLAIDYPEATTITFCLAIGLAQTERELISGRTKSALGVRKKQLKEQGFFISKAGRRVTRLGNPGPSAGRRLRISWPAGWSGSQRTGLWTREWLRRRSTPSPYSARAGRWPRSPTTSTRWRSNGRAAESGIKLQSNEY